MYFLEFDSKKDSYKKFGKEIWQGKLNLIQKGWGFKKIGFQDLSRWLGKETYMLQKKWVYKLGVKNWVKKLICFKKSGFTNLLEKELGKGVEFDSKELPFRGFWEKTMEKKVELNSKKEVFAKIISCET